MCWQPFARALLVGVVFSVLTQSGPAQAGDVCYFGECQPDPPQPRSVPVPDTMPVPTPRPVPEASHALPPFLARNMCLAGNVGVPVDNVETCSRIYSDYGARPTNGMPVSCAIISLDGENGIRVQVVPVETAGRCWGLRKAGGMPVQFGGRCAIDFSGAFKHWRLDVTQQECASHSVSKLVVQR